MARFSSSSTPIRESNMINVVVYRHEECLANKDFYSEKQCGKFLSTYIGMTDGEGYNLFDELEEDLRATFHKDGYVAILMIVD